MPLAHDANATPTYSPVIPMLRRSLAVLLAIPVLALPVRAQGVATVCKDGTTTTTTGRGACTGHGGVDKKAAKATAAAAKAEKQTAARPAAAPAMPGQPAPTRAAATMPATPAPTRPAAVPRTRG